MLAVSMIIVFLYGSMIWGIFPWFKETSWEGHLFGGLAGLLLSWLYRKEGPQRPKFVWEDEIEDNKIYDEEGNEIDLPSGEINLKMDQSPLMGDKFENLKMGDDLKMDDDALKTATPPQILYTYVEKNPKLNTDDADETDKIG